MSVLIFGADGFIARNLSVALTKAGISVVKAGRQKPHLDTSYITLNSQETDQSVWDQAVKGIDTVINCTGAIKSRSGNSLHSVHLEGATRLFKACQNSSVKRVIHFSALGASTDKPTEYQRTKGQAEEQLAKFAQGHFDFCILKPSLVVGPGGGSSTLFGALASLPVAVGFGDKLGKVQPVLIDDICDLVVRLVQRKEPLPEHLDVVGPKAMQIDEMMNILRQHLQAKSWLTLKMPAKILEISSYFSGSLTNDILNRDTVRMMHEGNTADPKAFAHHLGHTPHKLSDLSTLHPASVEERRNANLYFLKPFLRWSIGWLWVMTGVLSLGLYPIQESLNLINLVGVEGNFANILLFGSAGLDLLLGILLLMKVQVVKTALVQVALTLSYMTIALSLPSEYWLHPFAPLLKNIPLIIATLIMTALEKE
ncbi:SDR family oxidoreductase [Terasakiella pusilla]|uniref:SDR family oxidoreductase n=1 Tax=Terasakiella pusilla TaxID=64973 RepID=UPI003AA7E320